MAREPEDYRLNLDILNTRFPDHDMLTHEEVMAVTGCKSINTVKKWFKFNERHRLSKPTLARWMCGKT